MLFRSILCKYFDTENLAYWMAFQLLTGNTDTQSRNMYLYSPTNSDTFYVLDWDNDGMLMRKENQIRNISTGSSWEQGVSNYWGNVLFKRCLQTKSFRDELDKAVKREYRYMSAKTHQYDGGPLRVHHQAVFVEDARFHVRAADARPV